MNHWQPIEQREAERENSRTTPAGYLFMAFVVAVLVWLVKIPATEVWGR
jgi:hypothetical protein